MGALGDYAVRQEARKRWHHAIQRHVVLQRSDGLACVWDVPLGARISRWLRPERAALACEDAATAWRRGSVTLWIIKTQEPKAAGPERAASPPLKEDRSVADPSPGSGR